MVNEKAKDLGNRPSVIRDLFEYSKKRKQEIGDRNLVGVRIENRRKELKMSQKDLLAKLQVMGIEMNSSGLSKIEGQIRGVTDKELVALSRILDLSINQLVGLE